MVTGVLMAFFRLPEDGEDDEGVTGPLSLFTDFIVTFFDLTLENSP